MSTRWALLLLAAAGCGGARSMPAADSGAVAIAFAAQPLAPGALVLTRDQLALEDLSLFGDLQSAPEVQLPDVTVEALAPSAPLELAGLPQGVYSRLRFSVRALHAVGQWRAHPLLVDDDDDDDDDDVVVDLRAPAGRELTGGQTVNFAVSIDPGRWLAAVDLDQASIDQDQAIRLGSGHNAVLVPALLAALPASFQLAAAR